MVHWNFAQIPGLEEEKMQLRKLAQQERIPHAQLFLGDYGSASLALALAFSRLVLCASPKGEEPCEQCPACIKSSGWVHPDLHFSFPVIGSKQTSNDFLEPWRKCLIESPYFNPADWFEIQDKTIKQGNINVLECHEIVQKRSYTVVEGRYKILLLWGVEFLGKEGNRLLKLIEEPPARTLFLFIGADASRILPTVLSRCQLFKIRPFTDEEVCEALIAKSLVSTNEAETLAFQADGNLGEAYRLVENTSKPMADLFLFWMRSCYAGTDRNTLKRAEELAALGREDQKTFFHYALHFVRQMILAISGNKEKIRLPDQQRTSAIGMAQQFDPDRLEELALLFSNGLRSIERNANPKILFLNASIQVHALFKDKVRYKSLLNG